MSKESARKNARRVLVKVGWGGSWILTGLFGVLLVIAAFRYQELSSLGEEGLTATAEVYDWKRTKRIGSRSAGYSSLIKYRFEVDGVTYSVDDATGRSDLWIRVGEDVYLRSRETKKIEVLFSKSDPETNVIAQMFDAELSGQILTIVVLGGLVALSVFLLILSRVFKRRWGVV